MIPDELLIDATRRYIQENDITEMFFADLLVREQIKDIPDASIRIHFDERRNNTLALENNRKHLNRFLNGEERIPLRLLRPWVKIMNDQTLANEICHALGGFFTPVPEPVGRSDSAEDGAVQHINRVLKEVSEALESVRKDALDNGAIDNFDHIRVEISEAMSALSGALEWCRVVAEEGAIL